MKVRTFLVSLAALMVSVLGACGTEDNLLFIVHNAYMVAPDCEVDETRFLSKGLLDVDNGGIADPKSYTAFLKIATQSRANPNNTNEQTSSGSTQGSSYRNYGGLSTNDIYLEEIQVSYDFTAHATQPTAATLAELPATIALPVTAYIPALAAKATSGGEPQSFVVAGADIIPSTVGDRFFADPELQLLLQTPAERYPFTISIRALGRTASGSRIESNLFTYPIDLCVDCLRSNPDCIDAENTCYPGWQDCR